MTMANATAKRTRKARQVFLAYTANGLLPTPELLRVYSKQSYQAAYDWLADLAERHGNAAVRHGNTNAPGHSKHPAVGEGKVALLVENPANGQRWWLERHEVL
jgi:hypothetical protein